MGRIPGQDIRPALCPSQLQSGGLPALPGASSARTRTRSRRLTLHPCDRHEAIAAARAQFASEVGQRLYAQQQGIESTISQAVRAFGLRRSRYRGLTRTSLQGVATAAAINLDRLAAWLVSHPLAPTRTSRFAALAIAS